MSTMDPAGDGGGGGTSTSVDNNVTADTPSTDAATPAVSQHPQHPPPSPLSGCYLLVVLPEPHTAQHKDLILNRLAKGFLSWDKNSCHVDLEKELQALVAQAPEGEEARNGERLIQYATENLVTEVLIHPQTNTLLQCIRNLLASFTKHRHIIHAGYTFGGNGSWILQDGTFSLADFLDAFSEHEVQRVLRAYENSVTVDVNCAGVGEWSTCRLSKEACTRSCRVRLNPDDVLTAGVAAIVSFTNYVGQYLLPQTLDQLMEPSDLVGNIRFSHPTLYVFPGGQGDAALFGINGFNMLVDGGFARKACFWDFARHLDRLDAVLVTRVNNSNVGGMSSVLRKKREMHVYPQIGHFFCNLVERRHSNSPDGDKDLDPLTLNLIDIGQEMMVDLRQINLRAHPCYRDASPINLYHKVGHGTLDMYVLSPSKDSREVREFLSKWHSADAKLFAGSHKKDSNNLTFPIQNLASICALLVWQPANPEDTITRILFPGSTPQHKIFEGFERLKHLDFLKHPVCSAKTLSPSTSLLALKDRPTIKQKFSLIDKDSKKSFDTKKEKRDFSESKTLKSTATEDIAPKSTPQGTPVISMPKSQPSKVDVKTKKVVENKKIETESKKMDKDLKETKRELGKTKDVETKKSEGVTRITKSDGEKIVSGKDMKIRTEPKKKDVKDSKPAKPSKIIDMPVKSMVKSMDKKPKPILVADRKDTSKGSPPTPKKTVHVPPTAKPPAEAAGKTTTPRPITKPLGKQSIGSSMPAKSAKDANNRKVVEQKNIEIASAASAAATASSAKPLSKPKPIERKPISRRAKPSSPSKAVRVGGSPAKSTRSTPTTSVKSDKDGVISRRVKGDRGTTDSSTVSTPSAGIDVDSMTKLGEKSLTEKSEDMSLDSIESKVLADLKEEREVVEEIEAVLKKAERIEGGRKDDHLEGDDDITAEATDKKDDDMTEDDVTADMDEAPGKKVSRKPSQELTEEDEYLIVEKEEIYIEDSAQSGDGEQKHVLDAVQSEKVKSTDDTDISAKEQDQVDLISEEKEKSDVPEKKLSDECYDETIDKDEVSLGHKEQEPVEEEPKDIVASSADVVQKIEDKDDSGKKDSEDMTKEPSSLSPDKFDSSEKKTTDTDPMKPEADQVRDQQVAEKLEESQERISTMESGATTTAPTLPEDERIPLDDIKEVIDEKYVADEVKEKDSVEQVKDRFPAPIPIESKPEIESFQVRPTIQGNVHREIVKTPDEVADLPVHEEVDPKLYRMEPFEKVEKVAKDEKSPLPPTTHQQRPQDHQQSESAKDIPTPTVKEQKGVFSFFGKVADKFEKGMDKLTGKSRRDSEKDIDEKSSSKSSSPKEAKPQEITLPKEPEKLETFENTEPKMSQVKVAAITDTAGFLQREIDDSRMVSGLPDDKIKQIEGIDEPIAIEKSHAKLESSAIPTQPDPVFETCVLKGQQKDMISVSNVQVEEDAEEVEALLEEASKKFKTVKDSLRDSLESLEDKIVEEEMVRAELAAASKDVVKDTLSEVVEKLEEMQPRMEDAVSGIDTKHAEKVKFDIPKYSDNDFDNEDDEMDVKKDLREAVRDVGEVLAGSAGILIDEKPQDVEEIVKKVAEELKRDDFLSHDVLFETKKTSDDGIKSPGPTGQAIIPTELTETEKVSPSEKIVEEIPVESVDVESKTMSIESSTDRQIHEETCVKAVAPKTIDISSPILGDKTIDKIDAMKICSDLMDEDAASASKRKSIVVDDHETAPDVMESGIETVCVKERVEDRKSQEDLENREIKDSDIVFDRKLSPDKAQMVMVTPDSMPTSPKFPVTKTTQEQSYRTSQLSNDLKNQLDEEGPLENIIEKLVFVKKTKITIEIVEYITVSRRIPREKVIHTIEEIIIKKRVPRDSVIADLDLLQSDTASSEKRADIEQYIDEEYITKNKKITIDIVEEISIKKFVTKRIVIEIIEEIIVRRKIPRDDILDISEKELSNLKNSENQRMDRDEVISETEDEQQPDQTSVSSHTRQQIQNNIIDEYVTKNRRITPHIFDDICSQNKLSRRVILQIIHELVIKLNVPKSSILDISDIELEKLLASETEQDDEKSPEAVDEDDDDHESVIEEYESVTSEKLSEIKNIIIEEYISKSRRITPYVFEDICVRYKIPRRILIELIETIIIERKIKRDLIIDITDLELSELLDAAEVAKSEEDELIVRPIPEQDFDVPEDGEDKLVDGFVSIPAKDVATPESVSSSKTVELAEQALIKESDKDVTDDFEAVEQEYKIHGTPITTDGQSILTALTTKPDEKKISEGTEEAIEDDVSDVVEADEKTIESMAPITSALPIIERKSDSISETSEAYDTMDKDFVEIHADASSQKSSETLGKHLETADDGMKKTDLQFEQETKTSITDRKDSKTVQDDKVKIAKAIEETVRPQTDVVTGTEAAKVSTAELKEDKYGDGGLGLGNTDSVGDINMRVKRSIDEGITEGSESAVTTATVRRMLVTASSEDGGHETEVCPTGSIVFTKTTPDDSLKSSPIKTTPDQDSLVLDKESLRSGASTPEKDSISGKSTPGTKDGDKISAEDSLDKSPSGVGDLQDLEDSLEKSEPTKLKKVEIPSSPIESETAVESRVETDQTDHGMTESYIYTKEDDTSAIKPSELAINKIIDKDLQEFSESPVPTASGVKIDQIETLESGQSPNVAGDEVIKEDDLKKSDDHDAALIDRSKSPSIVDDHRSEKADSEIDEKVLSPSIASEALTGKELVQHSRSPSIAGVKITGKDLQEPLDKSRSPSVVSESYHEPAPVDHSKSPSIVDDRHSEKASSEIDKKSRSPSVASETPAGKELIDRTRSPSIAGEKVLERDVNGVADESKLPSDVSDSHHDKVPSDHSKSPSVVDDQRSEKVSSEADEKSRSPSVASETLAGKELMDRSRSPSIAGEKIPEKDVEEVAGEFRPPSVVSETHHDEAPIDRSKSPGIVGDRQSVKASSEIDEKSRSPSVASETPAGEELIDRSRSPSIAGEKIPETDVKKAADELKLPSVVSGSYHDKAPSEHSKSPSVVDDRQSEKASSEIDEKSRSPSIASETLAGKEVIDHSRSPSIAGDKISEKDVKEIVAESRSPSVVGHDEASIDRSKSPSIVDDRQSVKASSEIDEKSRSPSVASETPAGKELIDRSRSPSIAGEKILEKDVKEVADESKLPSDVSDSCHDKPPSDHSKSPSVIDDRQSEKASAEIDEKSRSPSVASEILAGKELIDRSRSPSIAGEKIPGKDEKEVVDELRPLSVSSETHHDEAPIDRSKSPSIVGDRQTEKTSSEIDVKSRSPSVASETPAGGELIDRTRSPSFTGEKIAETDVKEVADESKLPSVVSESYHDKAPSEHSKSPSVVDDRQSEKASSEIDEKSRSPSVASETLAGKELIDRSRSPSIAGGKTPEKDGKEVADESRSPSVSETHHDEAPIDRSKSPSIVGDRQSEKASSETDEKSRSPSVASETPASKELISRSRSPSIAGEQIPETDVKKAADEPKLPSVVSESYNAKAPSDGSKSPSVVDDRQSEKAISEIDEKSRSPSVASETPAGKELIDRSRSPSIAGEKIIEKDVREVADEFKLPSVVGESYHDKTQSDHSKSPSVVDDPQNEKASSEMDEKSRSPSVTSGTLVGKELIDRSRSPSIAGEKITDKDVAEVVHESKVASVVSESHHEQAPVDRSTSPSIVSDRHSEKAGSEIDEKSRSPSVASEAPDGKDLIDRSRSPSIAGEKITQKDVTEIVQESKLPSVVSGSYHEQATVDGSKSPSIVSDRHSEKAGSEIDEKSRSPSVASEAPAGKDLIDRSRSPSIAGEKITDKDVTEGVHESKAPSVVSESHHEQAPVDGSKSPSIVSDRYSEKAGSEVDEKSRSPSVASEAPAGKDLIDRSRSPSIAGEKITEKDVTEIVQESKVPSVVSGSYHEQATVDGSKSPSIVSDRHSEKADSEIDEKSRSPSVASEAPAGKDLIDRSRSPSIAGEKITEKDVTEIVQESKVPSVVSGSHHEQATVDGSKSPSIVSDRHSEKAGSEIDEKSRSPSVVSEAPAGKDLIDRSRSPSIAGEKITDKDETEEVHESKAPSVVSDSHHERATVDGSKSPNIVSDQRSEKAGSEIDEKSRSPSVASEAPGGKDLIDRSRSPSIAGEKITEKDVTEIVQESKMPSVVSGSHHEQATVDGSKSPSIVSDRYSEKAGSEIDEKSRSPSVASEAPAGLADRSRSPSIVGENITGKDVTEVADESRSPSVVSETHHDSAPIDRSKSPSIGGDRPSEKASSVIDEKSRSPSVASETPAVKELIDRSRSSSIAGEKIPENDVKEVADESTSPSVVSESYHDKAPSDGSKSPSVVGDRHSEKADSEIDEKSRSPSVASETFAGKDLMDRSRSPSIAGEKITEKDASESVHESKAPSVVSESHHEPAPVDRSKSPSIVSDRHSEKAGSEVDEKSRSTSVASEAPAGHIDRSRSPSIAGENISGKDVKEAADKSRSPSVVSETHHGEAPIDRSKSPSIVGDRPSEKASSEIDEKSRSPSVASETPAGKELIDRSRSPSIAGGKTPEKDVKEVADESRSPSVSETHHDEAPIDRSKSPSIVGDRQSEKASSETDEKSRSPSVASETPAGKELIDRSRSPSIAGEKITEKDIKEVADESKLPSVVSESYHGKAPTDDLKLPSVIADRHGEKAGSEIDEKSRSASIASETPAGKELMDRSRSPSIAGDKIPEKDVKKVADESESPSGVSESYHKAPSDGSKSPSVVGDRHSEKADSEIDEKSRSPSVASEAPAGKDLVDRSRSPSIAGEKITDKDVTEGVHESKAPSVVSDSHHEQAPVDRSKSPSIVSDRHSEKAGSEVDEKSRSPSVASEAPMDADSTERSKLSNVADDHGKEEQESKIDGKSPSPSIVSETMSGKELAEPQKSLSHTDEVYTESKSDGIDSGKVHDTTVSADHSKLTDITGDADKFIASSEVSTKSQRSSIVIETRGSEGLDECLLDPHEEDRIEDQVHKIKREIDVDAKTEDEATVDHSKPSSITGDGDGEKGISNVDEKSLSPDTASEKHSDKEPAEHTKLPSVPQAKMNLQDLEDEIKFPSAGDKTSSDKGAASDMDIEKDTKDIHTGSRKIRSVSDKDDGEHSTECPEMPIRTDDKSAKEELVPVKSESPVDRSPMASYISHAHSEPTSSEADQKSRSPSVVSEKDDSYKPAVSSRTPSTTDEKIAGDCLKQPVDKPEATDSLHKKIGVEAMTDGFKTPSDASDGISTHDAEKQIPKPKEVTESLDKSKSPSDTSDVPIAQVDGKPIPTNMSPKHEDTISTVDSRTPSIVSDKEDTVIRSPSIDGHERSRPCDDTYSALDSTKHLETLKSPSLGSDESKSSIDNSKSPIELSHKPDNIVDDTKKSESSSSVSEKPTEQQALSIHAGPEVEASDGSTKSTGTCEVKHSEVNATVTIEKSGPLGLTDEGDDENESLDRFSTSSIAGDDLDRQETTVESVLDDSQISKDVTESPQKSRSSSFGSVKCTESTYMRDSQSHGIHGATVDNNDDNDDKKDYCRRLTDESQSTGIVNVHDSKLDGKDAVQALQKLAETIADKSAVAKQVVKSPVDETPTPKDRSRSHSVYDGGEKTPLGRSRTASLFEDRIPEGLSLRVEAKTGFQEPVGTYSYDESDETKSTKDGQSRKSSLKDGLDADKESPSTYGKSGVVETGETISKEASESNDKYIAGQFIDSDDITTEQMSIVEEYIVNNYIMKKEKITSRSVDEIVTVYSMPKHMILELIEFIIMKENVPRDFVVDYPKYDGTCDSAVVSKKDHVDVIDIAPAKRYDIESYIHEEFIKKHKTISSKLIDELVARESVSRNIIIMILEEIMSKERINRSELMDDELFDSSSKILEANTHGPTGQGVRLFDEESLPSISNEYNIDSQPSISSLDIGIGHESGISEQKRKQVETYVMEECVKKGRKITILVLEQIMTKLSISRSVLLDIIENIIVTRKMSRKTMVDEAIYDDVDTMTSRSSESSLAAKDRIVEFSGKSTPDPKSSGYSTPETRQYDDKLRKEISSYSSDLESPFHKAFVGGMTEIRTTHITTLSGKSTPDFGGRGETPESEEKLDTDRTPAKEFTSEIRDVASSMSAGEVAVTKTDPMQESLSTLGGISKQQYSETSAADEKAASDWKSSSESHQSDMHDTTSSATKLIKDEVISDEKSETIVRVLEKKVIDESGLKKDEDEEPEIIRRIIRREIIEHENDDDMGLSEQQGSSDMIETITSRTTKTIVTENMPHYEKCEIQTTIPEKEYSESESAYVTRIAKQESLAGGPITADVKTTITTVTTVTEPDGKVTTKKNVHESTDTLEGEELLEKLIDSTKTEDSGTLTDAKSIESLTTEKIITETIKTVAGTVSSASATGIRGDSDIGKASPDSASHDEKSDNLIRTTKITAETVDHAISPIIKDLISDDRKSTSDLSVGSESRSGRSTPDKRADNRSNTATPEGFRSSEVIRTTITTTRTMSEDGDIITTTKEITEATNEKGEVTVLTEKTNVKVEDKVQCRDIGEFSPKRTHAWEGSEERHGYSDDEVPGSPLSTASIVGYSPQSTYHFGEQSFDKDSSRKTVEFSEADMSSSFYGELPDLPPRVTTLKSAYLDSECLDDPTSGPSGPATSIDADFSFKKFTVGKEPVDTCSDKSATKRYVDDADLDVEKVLMERKDTKTDRPVDVSDTVAAGYTNGNLTKPSLTESTLSEQTKDEKDNVKKDPLADWGSPLGLPSPKPPRKFNLRTTARPSDCTDISPDSLNLDAINSWGEPLRLPSPGPVADEASNKASPGTPKKERKQPKKVTSENIKNRKRSESPSKNEKKTKDARNKIQPVYMDLTYVPHHGNSYYTSLDFFKRIRARYYVFSGTEPSREVYDALLDAKKTWEDKDLEVTMIPTYDTDTLGYWVADNEEALAANHIDLSPSASRCTINLQDHETSCSAYRLEF